jgi:hypothetical protein
MILESYKRHVPALIIMLAAAGSWAALLPSLPDPMTVRCAFSKAPVFSGPPIEPFLAMCGFMVMSHAVIVLIDLLLFARVLPGYIMASTDWIAEGFTAVFYLSILADGAKLLPCGVGIVIGAVALLVILAVLYRRSAESVEQKARPLFDAPYYERVRASLMTVLLFFIRPLFPSYIIIVPEGIRLMGVLYDVTYHWDRIAQVKKGDILSNFSNRPIKLYQRFSGIVEIRLKDRRNYPVISVADRDRFLETAARFMTGA